MKYVLRWRVRSRGSAERTLALMKDCAIIGPNVDVAVQSVLGMVQSAELLYSGIAFDRSSEDGVAAGR